MANDESQDMSPHNIEPDRTALVSEFSTDPDDHDADEIRVYSDSRTSYEDGVLEREWGGTIVQLWKDGDVVETVKLVG